ncbi:hypothetical protein IWW37_003371 [Coemansia sp. RSA 2050]|nr:hypothetical protein IWW37_003371 [Coemansia sp. RSA 2050]
MAHPEVRSRQLRMLRPVSGAAFGLASNDYDGGLSSEDDLAAVRPPSALFYHDPAVEHPSVLGAPAPLRRSVEDRPATGAAAPSWGYQRERLRRLPSLEPLLLPLTVPVASEESFLVGRAFTARGDTTPPPLGSEMPPVSPFFARIRPSDIEDVRETVKRASISRRRNTLAGSSEQLASWSPSHTGEQSFASLRLGTATATPARASLAGTLAGWQSGSIGRWSSFIPLPESREANLSESLSSLGSAEDWLINQEPPISPLFADENRMAAERRKNVAAAESSHSSSTRRPMEGLGAPERSARWYKVDVHSLFSSPLTALSGQPHVAITDLCNSGKPADPNDPDVQRALRQYPLTLALCSHQQKQQSAATSPTGIRVPSQRNSSPATPVLSTPALSFTISTDGTSDRPVRSVDVEAMAAAYLPPRVHASLGNPNANNATLLVDGVPLANSALRTPSESSTSTLADGFRSEVPKEQPKPAPRTLLQRLPRRSDIGPVAMVPLKSDTPSGTFPMPRQQLRASASVMNLRGAYSERSGSLPLPSTPLSAGARRSTLATRAVPQALFTPANGRHSIIRRNSAMELNASRTQPLPPRRIQNQHQLPPALPLLASFATGEAQRTQPSMSLGFGMAESPMAPRSGMSSGLRTPSSLNNLSQKSQLQSASTRGRLQSYGEPVPASLMPMRSASLEIPATNGSVYSMSSGSSSSRTPRIAGSIQTPLSLRKSTTSPPTESLFGRRRGTSTTAPVALGSAVTPTAPRLSTTASRTLKLSRPPPMPATGLLASGPRSAPVPAYVPESFSSLPPLPKRMPAGRSRTDVRTVFGYAKDSQPLPRLPARLASVASNPVDMYRGLASALPLVRASSKRCPE